MVAPARIIDAIDHAAVQATAVQFFRHLRRCQQWDLPSERLCKTGRALREAKYEAVAQKWRR